MLAATVHDQRIRLRKWMAVASIFPSITADDFNRRISRFWTALYKEPVESIRHYPEWLISLGLLRFGNEELFSDLFQRLLNHSNSPANCIALLTITGITGAALSKAYTNTQQDRFFQSVFDTILPLFLHNNHTVRLYALYVFDTLWKIKPSTTQQMPAGYLNMSSFISQSDYCHKFLQKVNDSHHPLLNSNFQLADSLSVQTIFSLLPRFSSERISKFTFMNLCNHPSSTCNISFGSEDDDGLLQVKQPASKSIVNAPTTISQVFQEKANPWSAASLHTQLADFASSASSETSGNRQFRKAQFDIVVVASLLEKIQNIAGLCRTVEVLGLQTLIVPDLKMAQSEEFGNIAMTSDRWMNIQQVTRTDLASFIEKERTRGSRIVALEQSSSSTSLEHFVFAPRQRVILILGNEREGVPVDILHAVDECVVIPQHGMIRSLNVHVSGAIVVWEACKQTLLSISNSNSGTSSISN